MNGDYTALVQLDGEWWIGWVQRDPRSEFPGEDAGGTSGDLRERARGALELNRAEARAAVSGSFEEVSIPE